MLISDKKSIDLNLLKVFVILWETRSVSRASEVLSISQPAVSHSLRRLRESLGDNLFISTRAGLLPTSRSNILIGPIKDALNQISQTLDTDTRFLPEKSDREFKIGMLDLVEYWVLPAILAIIVKEAQGVLVHGVSLPDSATSRLMLERDEIDVILTDKEPIDKNLRSERLYEEYLTTLIWKKEKRKNKRYKISARFVCGTATCCFPAKRSID